MRTIAAGTWARSRYFEMRVSIPEPCPLPSRDPLDERYKRISIEVTVRASGDVQVPANPYYALLLDRAHDVYEASLNGCEAALTPTLLQPGQTARGWISFEIPKSSAELELLYAPALAGVPREELVFDLGPG